MSEQEPKRGLENKEPEGYESPRRYGQKGGQAKSRELPPEFMAEIQRVLGQLVAAFEQQQLTETSTLTDLIGWYVAQNRQANSRLNWHTFLATLHGVQGIMLLDRQKSPHLATKNHMTKLRLC